MLPEDLPLAAVSLTFRDAPTALRVRASTPLDETAMARLRAQGVTGLLELHTCARSLWLVAGQHPGWTGSLVQSMVASRLGNAVLPTTFTGEDALRHALRVSTGLESFVQGEADVGAQMTAAFDGARAQRRSCLLLNTLQQSTAHLLAEGRDRGFVRPNRGLGQLAVMALVARGADRSRPVGVVGAGAIGGRVIASLRRAGWAEPVVYNRTPRPGTLPLDVVGDHEAVVLCTAGPSRWFRPGPHHKHVVDLGLPPQAHAEAIGLDALLAGDELCLSPERLQAAELAVERELEAMLRRVRTEHRGIAGVQALRDQFLEQELAGLFTDAVGELSDDQRRRVMAAARGALRQYSHRMITLLREEPLVSPPNARPAAPSSDGCPSALVPLS